MTGKQQAIFYGYNDKGRNPLIQHLGEQPLLAGRRHWRISLEYATFGFILSNPVLLQPLLVIPWPPVYNPNRYDTQKPLNHLSGLRTHHIGTDLKYATLL